MARGNGAGSTATACTRGGTTAPLWLAPCAALVDAAHLTEERFDTEAHVAGLAPAVYLAVQGERWQMLLADAKIVVRVDSELLPSILADGRVKSQFETGTSHAYIGDYRAKAEADVFDYQPDLPASERPVYGYLDGSEGARSVQHFGDAKLILADRVRPRTTVIAVDSLSSHTLWNDDKLGFRPLAVPELIDAASHRSLLRPLPAGRTIREVAQADPRPFVDGYAEAHVHGGLDASLIDAVAFDRPGRVPAETIELLKTRQIRCLGPDGAELDWIDVAPPATPGLVTVAQLIAGERVLPLRYNPSLDHEASTHPDRIEVGPAFYALTAPQRRHILNHELGHTFDDTLLQAQPELFDPEPWTDADGILLNGPGSNCCERIADAYAALCGPGFKADLDRFPVFAEVGRYALAHGYRLHPDAAVALAA